MKWGRQRNASLLLIAVLLATGCEAKSSVEAAQTAIVSAQTVLPGAQATAVAAATMVSNALSTAQPVITTLQALLAGAQLDLKTTPEGAANDAVTNVAVQATDAQGALQQVDPRARQAAAAAALLAAAQYYPNATIALKVVDSAGAVLVSGSMAPGQQTPSVQ